MKPSQLRELKFYFRTSIFGAVIFGLCYGYIKYLGIPGELNKSVADTAILLMGFSMLLSSVSYFGNRLDWTVVYRKYLGLIGFAFALAHLVLSWGAFTALLKTETWQQGRYWPAFAGLLALSIFTVMALVSNTLLARTLGKYWRYVLRTGYIAVLFVLLHVVLLKSPRWITWYQEGMKTPPSLSLIVAVFMLVVVGMRLFLWYRLSRRNQQVVTRPTVLPTKTKKKK